MPKIRLLAPLLFVTLLFPLQPAWSKAKEPASGDALSETEERLSAASFKGLRLRSIGPALTSGRIGDIAIHPDDKKTWIVAVASGGVWKTTNAGTSWTPIFDHQDSYSIGCVAIDPQNRNVLWVGTGENNSQRSVAYGDGVYKSLDGGKTWRRMGLEASEHIGKIVIDPRDSDIVWVAAQGPLWSAGGDRGLYKTTDGGDTWEAVLQISEHTGISDIVLDPRDPDTVYASAYQRRRRVWTIVNGGPESGLHKSTDGGKTWKTINSGLPKVDLGRIGLAISPADPEILYAIVEAARDDEGKRAGGFYRSLDRGESWERRSDYVSGSGQYYQEIIPDPKNPHRVYSNDVWMHVTEDGGKTFERLGESWKHVDNHALWINPDDTDHLVAGCDGGIYETFDRAATWRYVPNLPVTQFYKVGVDNDLPFYNVYGGTQDNFTLGGPSRTASGHGIRNSDWIATLGGDGFQTRVDPHNPDLVYSQFQYGNLHRFDRKSGEVLDITPQSESGEALRWNWDSPLIISPHSPTRLYYAAQRVYRSDDRGQSWRPVSGDLSRGLDRDELLVMGKLWPIDSVAKNASTSPYGNVVALSESPLVEGLVYAGTDDGLVQITDNGGESWRRIESFPGIPKLTYVNDLVASAHDADTVYAVFNNHKSGDFAPYLLVSTDRGRSWRPLHGDLPERGSTYVLVEDPVKPELLFAGTEFGIFFTVDGGQRWIELEGGMPTIAVRDLEIQERENDLVVATFGRGFYILDDLTPLRHVSEEALTRESTLFPVKRAWMYMESQTLGFPGKSFQGETYYAAENPPFGAVFTYFLKEDLKTLRAARHELELEQGDEAPYPSWDELRAEHRQEKPVVVLTVRDEAGQVVRRLEGPANAGMHRVAWDLRFPPSQPPSLTPPPPPAPWEDPDIGPMVVPGTYRVELARRLDGVLTLLGEPQTFTTRPLGTATLPTSDYAELLAFQRQTADLQGAILGADQALEHARDRARLALSALEQTPAESADLAAEVRALDRRLDALSVELGGDPVLSTYQQPQPPSIFSRMNRVVSGHWRATSAPTQSHRHNYELAAEAFAPWLAQLTQILEAELPEVEKKLDTLGAPWTPGRVPRWSR